MSNSIFMRTIVGIALLVMTITFGTFSIVRADTCIGGTNFNKDGKPTGDCATDSFSNSGIFGCNQTGADSMSVGSISALGSTYVPVSDAAVTRNTGYLIYKECVLDGIVKRIVESGTAGLESVGIRGFLTGRDGQPLFPVDLSGDVLARLDESTLHTLQGGELNTLHPALKSIVTTAVARDYMAGTRAPNQVLTCPYQGDLDAVLKGTSKDVWGGLSALTNPACNPLSAFSLAKEYTNQQSSSQVNEMMFRLMTGQGVYGVEEYNPVTGRYETKTPGSLVGANVQQLLTSGFRQLENATEIDQIVGALFSGLGSHIITDTQGLAGIVQSSAGQPSYLDQLVNDSSQKLKSSILGAASNILKYALKVEKNYLQLMTDIANNLTGTIEALRDAEDNCWSIVVPAVKEYAASQNISITASTTKEFSQKVINNNIAEYASIATENVTVSKKAVALINNLSASIANTSSLEAQRQALLQLDSLVAQNAIHNQYDISGENGAQNLKKEVKNTMKDLLDETKTNWTESTNPNIGWCNIGEPAVIQKWIDRWKN